MIKLPTISFSAFLLACALMCFHPSRVSAQWLQTNGPYGGSVTSFAISGTNLFAGTDDGGVYRSTNNGTSWTATGLTSSHVLSLTVIGTNLFAGTYYDPPNYPGGVYRSTDNGTNWTATGLTDTRVYALAVSPDGAGGTNLFAGTGGSGVFLSTDNGTSWTSVNTDLTNTSVTSLAVSDTNLFAGTSGNGVYLSTDNGTSWSHSGLSGTDVLSFLVNGSNFFASTYDGIFRTTDNGANWTPADSGLTDMTVSCFAVNGAILFAGTSHGGVFRSTNNGVIWTAMDGPGNMYVRSLAVSGSDLFAATHGGIFLSTDNGTSWNDVNVGLNNTRILSLVANETHLFAGTSSGMFHSTDEGESWIDANTGLPNGPVAAIALLHGGTGGAYLFAAIPGIGVYRSSDNGDHWISADSGLTNLSVNCLAVDGTELFAGTWDGVFVTTDFGASWIQTNTGLTDPGVSSLLVTPSGTGRNNLFAGTYRGVFLSTDGGASWTNASTDMLNYGIQALSAGQDESGGVTILASLFEGWYGGGGGVYRSTDGGTSWSAAFTGLTNPVVGAFAVSTNLVGGTNHFAGTNGGGIGLSTDNGMNWTAVSTGLTGKNVRALAISPYDVGPGGSTLYAGTYGGGVWRRPLSEMSALPPMSRRWQKLQNAPFRERHDDVFFINAFAGWIVNGYGEIWKTTNAGTDWTLQFDAPSYLRSVGFADSLTGWAGVLRDNVDSTRILYQTTDGGANWAVVTGIPDPLPGGICGISVVNDSVMYASGRYYGPPRVIKTTDRGATWTTMDLSAHAGALVDCYFYSPDSGFVVGSTSSSYGSGYPRILFTSDGGDTWTVRYEGTRSGELCWKVFFRTTTTGYVSLEKFSSGPTYYLKTTDKGVTWSEQLFLNYRFDVQGIAFVTDSIGWLGGWGGHTYQTTDAGASWHLAGFGYYVNRFQFVNDSLAYSVGQTVYRYSGGQIISGVSPNITVLPTDFGVEQNFPNPFNPSTTIRYWISISGYAAIKMYNILGQEVATLVNEHHQPGSYEVTWDAHGFASGVYFYRLQMGSFVGTKKLVLMR